MFLRGIIGVNSDIEQLRSYERSIQFATINLAMEPLNNELVYNALSHLALIPPLDIHLPRYENLRVHPNSERLNVDVCDYAEIKLKQAEEIVNEIRGSYRFVS